MANLTLRSIKGSSLTYDEVDGNFEYFTGSYMTAVANQYALGTNQVNFRVSYGNCTFESGSVVKFNVVHSDNVVLSGESIATWGEDDSVILDAIADAQGTTIISVVSGSMNSFGF